MACSEYDDSFPERKACNAYERQLSFGKLGLLKNLVLRELRCKRRWGMPRRSLRPPLKSVKIPLNIMTFHGFQQRLEGDIPPEYIGNSSSAVFFNKLAFLRKAQ